MSKEALLKVNNLKKHFSMGKGQTLKAVDDVSFHIKQGETFGIVGESGCGKSTAGRTIIGLYNRTEGDVLYDGKNVHTMTEKERFAFHRKMQMIFQDPYASLNPRSTVQEIISEPMEVHGLYPNKKERLERVYQLLEDVGLNRDHANRYPHEFSGGQRQRIGIARALALDPEFIIADEPISALDVSVQAQVVNLLKGLQKKKGLTYLFIAHDLSMVKHISDRIGVMYLGNLVELTTSENLYKNPLHPYTQALLSAIPIPDPDVEDHRERIILEGELPSPMNPPSGCVFRTRCPYAMEACASMKPEWQEIEKDHFVACHLYNEKVTGDHNRPQVAAAK
ncbi:MULTISPECIES: ABC transporter ATP-binding protein [Cytobacillus]|jgi:peptide/nickel transport system ATP-binding protein|uniref:Oligopeptide ABC transporter ATP-binding protein OppF n=3 Tax=Cytobacillus TaxID=2675230 RepID=A0A161JTP5_9BACI|nr:MULTISPECIES: oligopeptide/dipeptide ABC transporter ATP-binding protein [Cytobacillus]MBY0157890.1 ATP-binding cassette domain-containing protein [Cytobacillus firmus]AND37841.1 oligopeptide ABC transporter ATP-binding protein OppF [Cytobacillus oceanisediminis 2691]MBU8772798.1 ATP-binding cassette domain-containing protein [Cytobacillus oceanisediminis]MCM3395414.1 ATP-binding cassette domain-containing protein [Cytobacillus oceanisediminis]MCM3405083.1 ATP-binding cassette domain-contai